MQQQLTFYRYGFNFNCLSKKTTCEYLVGGGILDGSESTRRFSNLIVDNAKKSEEPRGIQMIQRSDYQYILNQRLKSTRKSGEFRTNHIS